MKKYFLDISRQDVTSQRATTRTSIREYCCLRHRWWPKYPAWQPPSQALDRLWSGISVGQNLANAVSRGSDVSSSTGEVAPILRHVSRLDSESLVTVTILGAPPLCPQAPALRATGRGVQVDVSAHQPRQVRVTSEACHRRPSVYQFALSILVQA